MRELQLTRAQSHTVDRPAGGLGEQPIRRVSAKRRTAVPHVPPLWAWGASVVLQVASAAALTSYTYFFIDDFVFLRQGQTVPFGLSYLRLGLFEHFSPVSRFLDKVVATVAPLNFTFAHVLQLLMYAATVAAVGWLLVTILGNGWRAFVLTVFFGQSLFLMRLLNWWTATANILPATFFMALTLVGYLRWRRVRARRWFLLAVCAFVGALLDYETGMLTPVYVALLTLLVLEDDLGPRAWLRTLWRERSIWIAFGVIEAIALVNYYTSYYFAEPHPRAGQVFHFLGLSFFDGLLPALGGIADPASALGRHAVVIAAIALLAASVVGLALYVRPRAWRCLAALAIVFLVTMLPLGLNRIHLFGVTVGQELYYQQSVQLMVFVLIAFAIGPTSPRVRPLPGPIIAAAARVRALPYGPAALAAAVLALYGVLYVTSVHALAKTSWQPSRAHSYVSTLEASIGRVTHRTGQEPMLIDQTVPGDVLPSGFSPFDHYDQFFATIGARVQFDRAGGPTYVVNTYGRLLPVRFQRLVATVPKRPECSPASQFAPVRIGLPPVTTHTPSATGMPSALRVVVRMGSGGAVTVALTNGVRVLPDITYPQAWPQGPGAYYVPLTVASRVDGVSLGLPPGSCVTSVELGTFAVAGRPV